MEEKMTLAEQISAMIADKKFKDLKGLLVGDINPVDIAEAFEDLNEKELIIAFRMLSKETAAIVFVEIPADLQELIITSINDRELKEMLDELYVDDAVDIIEEMPANVVARILKTADPDTRRTINEILLYPEDSAGSIMTPEYVALKKTMTVIDAFEHIRKVGVDKETIYTCYVTENRHLIGVVSVKSMLLASPQTQIEALMHTNFISVMTTDDKEFVASQIKKYGFMALPVVDKEQRLVGIVTIDDAMDVIEEEATEDMEIMAAMSPSEKPYLKTSVFATWKQRIPWLLLLMVSATFTGMIISSFEAQLAAFAALTAFIPMLMDTGGNSGSQASVTVIRALALDEVEPKDVFRVIWKEIRVSALCGATLAVANFVKIMLVEMLLLKTLSFDAAGFKVAAVVCITLAITVVVAKLIGCTLPILAKKLKLDPAVMASPFITTAVDAISLLVYFAVASTILGV
ncbi:MAG: magnesium transporter [Clostridia bacterium]|nr:magnesium transporter [Clostridia bacterium]